MKKVIYIGIAVVALGLASCSKEEIKPNIPTDTAVPVWKANTGGGDNVTDPNGGSSNEGGITDPNENEELSTENTSDGEN
jgi:hypothetical protein